MTDSLEGVAPIGLLDVAVALVGVPTELLDVPLLMELLDAVRPEVLRLRLNPFPPITPPPPTDKPPSSA